MIPDLDKGDYRIKVVTQFANGVKLLKTPKSFVYTKNLQVEGEVRVVEKSTYT